MKKLDEILLCGWKVEITIGNRGTYFVTAMHYNYTPVDVDDYTLKGAIEKLYKLVWRQTK